MCCTQQPQVLELRARPRPRPSQVFLMQASLTQPKWPSTITSQPGQVPKSPHVMRN